MSVYRPTVLFRAAALFFVVAAAWLAGDVWQEPRTAVMFLFVGVVVIAVGMALSALSRAEFDGETLTYTVPLRGARRIDRGQIDSVEIGGRRTQALLIGYHPRGPGGHIDREALRFLNLPPLQEQWDLFERLGGEREVDGEDARSGDS